MADFLTGFFDHSAANVHGGHDLHSADGSHLGHTADNVHGGVDVYNEHGQQTGYTMENALGGHDTFDMAGHKVQSTMSHTYGGESVHNDVGRQIGTVRHGPDSVTFESIDGQISRFRNNLMGGVGADPLTNMGAVEFPSVLF